LWEPGDISYDEDDVSEEDAEELERSFCSVKADLLWLNPFHALP